MKINRKQFAGLALLSSAVIFAAAFSMIDVLLIVLAISVMGKLIYDTYAT